MPIWVDCLRLSFWNLERSVFCPSMFAPLYEALPQISQRQVPHFESSTCKHLCQPRRSPCPRLATEFQLQKESQRGESQRKGSINDASKELAGLQADRQANNVWFRFCALRSDTVRRFVFQSSRKSVLSDGSSSGNPWHEKCTIWQSVNFSRTHGNGCRQNRRLLKDLLQPLKFWLYEWQRFHSRRLWHTDQQSFLFTKRPC